MQLENYDFNTGQHTYVIPMFQMNTPLDAKFYQIKHNTEYLYGNTLEILFGEFIEQLKKQDKYDFIEKLKEDFSRINKISSEMNDELYISSTIIKFPVFDNSAIHIAINKKEKDHYMLNKFFQFSSLNRAMFNHQLEGEYPYMEVDDLIILKYYFKEY